MSNDEMSLDDLLNFDAPAKTEAPEPVAEDDSADVDELLAGTPEPVVETKKTATRKPRVTKPVEETAQAPTQPAPAPNPPAPSPAPTPKPPVAEDPEDAEIARLKAELEAPKLNALTDASGRLRRDLSPKEQEIVRLRDELAQRQAEEFEKAELKLEEAGEDAIVFHVKKDGLTTQGKIWYRGEPMRFERGGIAYEQTKDRFGNSWVDEILEGGERAQYRMWGDVYLGIGPWPGLGYEDEDAARIAARINGAVPVL